MTLLIQIVYYCLILIIRFTLCRNPIWICQSFERSWWKRKQGKISLLHLLLLVDMNPYLSTFIVSCTTEAIIMSHFNKHPFFKSNSEMQLTSFLFYSKIHLTLMDAFSTRYLILNWVSWPSSCCCLYRWCLRFELFQVASVLGGYRCKFFPEGVCTFFLSTYADDDDANHFYFLFFYFYFWWCGYPWGVWLNRANPLGGLAKPTQFFFNLTCKSEIL